MTVDPDDLAEELEVVCLDAIGGDPPGDVLAARLVAVVRAALLRHGLGGAQVDARSGRKGTFVNVRLDPPGPRAREIRLQWR